jgi:hypothetical protein
VQAPPAQQAQQQQDGEQQPCECANQAAQDPSEVRLGAACMATASAITCSDMRTFYAGAPGCSFGQVGPGRRKDRVYDPTALHFQRAQV